MEESWVAEVWETADEATSCTAGNGTAVAAGAAAGTAVADDDLGTPLALPMEDWTLLAAPAVVEVGWWKGENRNRRRCCR